MVYVRTYHAPYAHDHLDRAGTCATCGANFSAPERRVVTITDSDRVVWTGPYDWFQLAHIDAISVSEWSLLWAGEPLMVEGMGESVLCITLDRGERK